MERIMVTIPSELLGEVDSVAQKLKQNRSQLIRIALNEFLQRLKEREFESLMAEGYRETSGGNSGIVAENRLLQAAAVEDAWKWNDE